MPTKLSQKQLNALLASLVGAGPETATPTVTGHWAVIGDRTATVLSGLLNKVWHQFIPLMSVTRGESFVAREASRVVSLGAPLDIRLWFFWGAGAQQEIYDAVINELGVLLGARLPHEWLTPANTPFPSGAVALPFEGIVLGRSVPLALGTDARGIESLRHAVEHLGTPALRQAMDQGSGPDIGRVEVDVHVYVGGGVYSLAELGNLQPGTLLPLLTEVDEPAVLTIGGRIVARGEIVMDPDNSLAVRITEVHLTDDPDQVEHPAWLENPRTS